MMGGLFSTESGRQYWRECVKAAVQAMHKEHERLMKVDPDYRRRQEAIAAEYARIFNNC